MHPTPKEAWHTFKEKKKPIQYSRRKYSSLKLCVQLRKSLPFHKTLFGLYIRCIAIYMAVQWLAQCTSNANMHVIDASASYQIKLV